MPIGQLNIHVIQGAVSPLGIASQKLWVDSVNGVTGSAGGAIDAIDGQNSGDNDVSNTAGVGTRPVLADSTINSGAYMFKGGTKNGIHGESGGDWLSFDGSSTAANSQCATAMTVFHVSRHTNSNSSPTNAYSTPLTILGSIDATTYTSVGFSGGTPRFITWGGGSYLTYNATASGLNDGTPHSVGWVYSGTNLKCYVDGILDSSQTVTAYQTTNGANSITGGAGVVDGFQGGIAEVMFWDAALSQAQISFLHSRAVGLWF